MKKIILTLGIIALVSIGAKAQDFLLGGGVAYGTFRETLGFDFRGDLRFSSGWAVVPHFTGYLPDRVEGNALNRRGFREVNLDVHRLFNVEQINFYPLAGLNFSTHTWKYRNGSIDRKTEIGINLGGGLEYFFTNKVAGLFETKYVVGDYDQWVITFGFLFKLTN